MGRKVVDIRDNQKSIISLAQASPFYVNSDIIAVRENYKMIFDCPSEIKAEILNEDRGFIFRDNETFNGSNNFEELSYITGITDMVELIEKHKAVIGDMIVRKLRNNELFFNGRKYGVDSIIESRRDDNEKPTICLKLFETDYFTHRVCRSIYRELVDRRDPIINVNKIWELKKYRALTTSLGINLFIINKGKIIMVKRSKYAGVGDTEDKWHTSVTEGFNMTDGDSISHCAYRGIREELGINTDSTIQFMGLILDKNNFEIGLAGIVETDIDFEKMVDFYENAQDSALESSGIMEVSNIEQFMEEYRMTDVGKHILKMVLTRESRKAVSI